jgi:hypothetical protein|tara:strand:+ start:13537 stop:13710 length:174 start_codon:yes stop_codon:yes gene_type:complete
MDIKKAIEYYIQKESKEKFTLDHQTKFTYWNGNVLENPCYTHIEVSCKEFDKSKGGH